VPQRQIPGYVYACMQDRLDHTGLPSHLHWPQFNLSPRKVNYHPTLADNEYLLFWLPCLYCL